MFANYFPLSKQEKDINVLVDLGVVVDQCEVGDSEGRLVDVGDRKVEREADCDLLPWDHTPGCDV